MAQFIDEGPPTAHCLHVSSHDGAIMRTYLAHQHRQVPELTLKTRWELTWHIFLFSCSPLRRRPVCQTLIHPSVRHQSKSSLASGPDIRGMSGQQLAVCSRMRTPVWITSIRTQPETFSFTLLTSAGSKLKSCSPPLR